MPERMEADPGNARSLAAPARWASAPKQDLFDLARALDAGHLAIQGPEQSLEGPER